MAKLRPYPIPTPTFSVPSEDSSQNPPEITNLSQPEVTSLSRSKVTNLSGSDKTCLDPKGPSDSRVPEDPDVSELLSYLTDDSLESYLLSAVNPDESKNRPGIKPPDRSGRQAYARRTRGKSLTTYKRLTRSPGSSRQGTRDEPRGVGD